MMDISPSGSTRADFAYAEIKARILRLEMPPGSAFTESELAEALNVSKTPVREALTRLRREALVEIGTRTRYRVTPIILKDIRDLFALRTLLEAEAASQAAVRLKDQEQLQVLEDLCRVSYSPDNIESIMAFLEHNTRFHLTVAEASGNARLVSVLAGLLEHMNRLFHLGLSLMPRPELIIHEHTELVNAIVRGDPKAARKIAIEQCRASQQMVIDGLLKGGAFDAMNVWNDHTQELNLRLASR